MSSVSPPVWIKPQENTESAATLSSFRLRLLSTLPFIKLTLGLSIHILLCAVSALQLAFSGFISFALLSILFHPFESYLYCYDVILVLFIS